MSDQHTSSRGGYFPLVVADPDEMFGGGEILISVFVEMTDEGIKVSANLARRDDSWETWSRPVKAEVR
jgi:hypothetical protein